MGRAAITSRPSSPGLRDSAIVNPASASPRAVTTKQCNDCHILENKFVNDDPENPGWIRSQGIGWLRSRCNTESNGTFGCVTCHNPHQGARATSTVEYEGKCLACHAATAEAAGGVASSSKGEPRREHRTPPARSTRPMDCLACHMPQVRIDSLHMELTDHYIRVRRDKGRSK